MDIIFASLPPYLDSLGVIFRKLGHKVFYINLLNSKSSHVTEAQRVLVLSEAGVLPLPLEDLPRLVGAREGFNDQEIQKKTECFATGKLLQAFGGLYPNNTDIVKKLRAIVQVMIAGQITTVAQANLWAKANLPRRHLLIYPSVSGFLAFDLASNVRLLILPVDILFKGLSSIVCPFRKVLHTINRVFTCKKSPRIVPVFDLRNTSSARFVFVTHDGLSYGNLFQKTLFYSEQTSSELHPENLLHFDYCGVARPSQKIQWVCLKSKPQSFLLNLFYALSAISRTIIQVRHARQIIGVMLLSKVYADYKFYLKMLRAYPTLKVALIDYEILCPKALLLAFEARKIRSIAAQERFVVPFYSMYGSIVDTYLCGSGYMAEVIRKVPSYFVEHCLPVGQYRSDILAVARQSPPPQILQEPVAQGRQIITALGFHTHLSWHASQVDPLLNWTAQRHFLCDMIRLSKDIPNCFIVLRFKSIDWIILEVFADLVLEIASLENIVISKDYEKSLFSYDLCAHSHLVIAKHSSLADECLSVGIPVLFHEYTHNTERLVADVFDYSPARIMCFNYQELFERSKATLAGDLNMTFDYKCLQRDKYGGLGDGKVKERIHGYIDALVV